MDLGTRMPRGNLTKRILHEIKLKLTQFDGRGLMAQPSVPQRPVRLMRSAGVRNEFKTQLSCIENLH